MTNLIPITTNKPLLLDPHKGSRRKLLRKLTADQFKRFYERFEDNDELNETASGYLTFSYGDLERMDLQQAPWLFKGLMRTDQQAMIYAKTGLGKTWMTLALSMIAAGGGKLLDWTNETPRKVLYIDGEMNTAELKGRMLALKDGLGVNLDALRDNFILCPRQMQRIASDNFLEVESEDSQLGILEWVLQMGIELVIVDNLTTLSGDIDENSSQDAKKFNTFLTKFKQKNIAVIVVHHQGKSESSGPRGSTAMTATLNLVMKLEESKGVKEHGKKCTKFTICFDKDREGLDSRPLPVMLTSPFEGDLQGTEVPEALQHQRVFMLDPSAESVADVLIKLLKTRKYKSQKELVEASGYSQGHVSQTLKVAISQGLMTPDELQRYYKEAKEAEHIITDAVAETEEF